MGFKDLTKVGSKDKREFLILISILLIASILNQFDVELGYWLTGWFANTALLYFFCVLILRDNTKNFSYFLFPLCYILSWTILILALLPGGIIIYYYVIFDIAIFGWLIITTMFTANSVYKKTIVWDEKLNKWSKSLRYLVRWGLFIGGFVISLVLIIFTSETLLNYGIVKYGSYSDYFHDMILTTRFFSIFAIWMLFCIGVISIFFDKNYYWLGLFFVFITFYALGIMTKAAKWEYGGEFKTDLVILPIALFAMTTYLLLGSIASLVGEQAEFLAKRITIFKPNLILIGLLFCMGFWEHMATTGGSTAEALQLLFSSQFFPLFAGIFGIIAIFAYNKKYRELELKEILGGETLIEQEELTQSIINPSYCGECGTANILNYKYCTHCGTELFKEKQHAFTRSNKEQINWLPFIIVIVIILLIYVYYIVHYYNFLTGVFYYGLFFIILVYLSWEKYRTGPTNYFILIGAIILAIFAVFIDYLNWYVLAPLIP